MGNQSVDGVLARVKIWLGEGLSSPTPTQQDGPKKIHLPEKMEAQALISQGGGKWVLMN